MASIQQRLEWLRAGHSNYAQHLAFIRRRSSMPGGLEQYGTSEMELDVLERQHILDEAERCLKSLRARIPLCVGRVPFDPAKRLQDLLTTQKVSHQDIGIGITPEELQELYALWQKTKAGNDRRKNSRWRRPAPQLALG